MLPEIARHLYSSKGQTNTGTRKGRIKKKPFYVDLCARGLMLLRVFNRFWSSLILEIKKRDKSSINGVILDLKH